MLCDVYCYVASCVTGGIHFVSAKLRDEENMHPDGTCFQQYKLHELLPDHYDHFFQMEPDVAPIQVSTNTTQT
jgi:hypothetical protein